jgi:hypothetical protein
MPFPSAPEGQKPAVRCGRACRPCYSFFVESTSRHVIQMKQLPRVDLYLVCSTHMKVLDRAWCTHLGRSRLQMRATGAALHSSD